MKELPQVKMTHIDLDITTEQALVTTIDEFRFIHKRDSDYVTVEIGDSSDYDYLDEIKLDGENMSIKNLERTALNWIFKHVELVEEKTPQAIASSLEHGNQSDSKELANKIHSSISNAFVRTE